MTSASPRSILVLSGRYHIISNASLVNNCILLSVLVVASVVDTDLVDITLVLIMGDNFVVALAIVVDVALDVVVSAFVVGVTLAVVALALDVV